MTYSRRTSLIILSIFDAYSISANCLGHVPNGGQRCLLVWAWDIHSVASPSNTHGLTQCFSLPVTCSIHQATEQTLEIDISGPTPFMGELSHAELMATVVFLDIFPYAARLSISSTARVRDGSRTISANRRFLQMKLKLPQILQYLAHAWRVKKFLADSYHHLQRI